jgi:hypothetical protein
MKLEHAFVTLALGLAACALVPACRGPSTEAQVHRRIVGTWFPQPDATPSSYKSITLSPDGALLRTSTNSVTEALGTWRIEAKLLVFTMAETNYFTSRWSGKKLPLPLERRYHIRRADEHDLVLAEAGPITLFGTNDEILQSFTFSAIDIRYRR